MCGPVNCWDVTIAFTKDNPLIQLSLGRYLSINLYIAFYYVHIGFVMEIIFLLFSQNAKICLPYLYDAIVLCGRYTILGEILLSLSTWVKCYLVNLEGKLKSLSSTWLSCDTIPWFIYKYHLYTLSTFLLFAEYWAIYSWCVLEALSLGHGNSVLQWFIILNANYYK